jgi:hypothetical protein
MPVSSLIKEQASLFRGISDTVDNSEGLIEDYGVRRIQFGRHISHIAKLDVYGPALIKHNIANKKVLVSNYMVVDLTEDEKFHGRRT